MILGKESATRHRFGASTRNADTGRSTPGAQTDTPITASFQPLSGKDREVLPEGKRSSVTLKAYSSFDFRVDDQHAGTPADEITYKGDRYVVYQVDPWSSLIPHYKILLIKKAEKPA